MRGIGQCLSREEGSGLLRGAHGTWSTVMAVLEGFPIAHTVGLPSAHADDLVQVVALCADCWRAARGREGARRPSQPRSQLSRSAG
ncbi:hypothetical protein GUJ93_ZPchr0010g9606 [Zizania palustris]|uniref:Uncharacterized protein n=1 Tax=Zizania palustris TaxID=103762 RepID=A0A8J6BNQ7_ZIZPA|nr:hypothetical protein GUJ93_ZPchr0010g9606 [Zizania palustris]